MAVSTKRTASDGDRDAPRSAHRREMAEGLLLLAALIVLALLAKLPAA